MSPQKVNFNERELTTIEIFELKTSHVIFADNLVIVKNESTGKEFTISEEGLRLLKRGNNNLTVISRNNGKNSN